MALAGPVLERKAIVTQDFHSVVQLPSGISIGLMIAYHLATLTIGNTVLGCHSSGTEAAGPPHPPRSGSSRHKLVG